MLSNLTMDNLEVCFKQAKEMEFEYIAVAIEMDGFPEREIIINKYANIDTKLDYYKRTYDENLIHNHARGIRITGFTYGDCFDAIEEDLMGV